MKNAKNLVVAASVAALHAGMGKQIASDLASIVSRITCADTYPGDLLLVPMTACEAISITLVDKKQFSRLKACASALDFTKFTCEDRVYNVQVAVYSINGESHKRIALYIPELENHEFFVRTLVSPVVMNRMFASNRIVKDSTIVMKDAAGHDFQVVLYHTVNSDRKRCAVVPPEAGVDLEFSDSILNVETDQKTNLF